MKLSTKGRYGLRAMYYLGNTTEDVLSLKYLASISGVTEPYLEKILGILKKHKLIETNRGALGGYRLSKSANEITIGEILRALENNLYLAECNKVDCKKNCPTKDIFNIIYIKFNQVLDDLTLEDMIKGQKNG